MLKKLLKNYKLLLISLQKKETTNQLRNVILKQEVKLHSSNQMQTISQSFLVLCQERCELYMFVVPELLFKFLAITTILHIPYFNIFLFSNLILTYIMQVSCITLVENRVKKWNKVPVCTVLEN